MTSRVKWFLAGILLAGILPATWAAMDRGQPSLDFLRRPLETSADLLRRVKPPRETSQQTAEGGAADRGPAEVASITLKTWIEPVTGMQFVWIPGGCYRMGSPPGEEGRDPDEGPVHEVCVDGFWMGRYEVSRAQFQIFTEASGYVTEAEKDGYSWVYTGRWETRSGFSWRRVGFEQDERHPVVHVSWNDAAAMAEWLSRESRGSFRLPTEAEWEWACRAGTDTSRHWGDDLGEACRYANAADRTAAAVFPAWTIHPCSDGFVHTAPVGRLHPNGFGLYDMLGNVWEWCRDVYDPEAYAEHSRENPVVTDRAPARVTRGGSWYSRPQFVRCAGRDHLSSPQRRSNDQGFRLVRKP